MQSVKADLERKDHCFLIFFCPAFWLGPKCGLKGRNLHHVIHFKST